MILTINKNGTITERNIKNYDNLYSICNYRNNNNFELLHNWNEEYFLYGKKNGRTGNENNYNFTDITEKYYGTLCIIKKINNEYESLSINEWSEFYNKQLDNSSSINNIEPISQIKEIDDILNDIELTYEEYEVE